MCREHPKDREFSIKLLGPMMSSKQSCPVYWSETVHRDFLHRYLWRDNQSRTVWDRLFDAWWDSSASSQEEIFPYLCLGTSEEIRLPVYKAHPCLGIGRGLRCNLALAALTRLPSAGRLGKLAFLIQKSPQVDLERITGMLPTGWNIMFLLFLIAH